MWTQALRCKQNKKNPNTNLRRHFQIESMCKIFKLDRVAAFRSSQFLRKKTGFLKAIKFCKIFLFLFFCIRFYIT